MLAGIASNDSHQMQNSFVLEHTVLHKGCHAFLFISVNHAKPVHCESPGARNVIWESYSYGESVK